MTVEEVRDAVKKILSDGGGLKEVEIYIGEIVKYKKASSKTASAGAIAAGVAIPCKKACELAFPPGSERERCIAGCGAA